MSRTLDAIQRRRAVLQARSRLERHRLVSQAESLLAPAQAAGRIGATVRRLMTQRWWMLALAAAALVVRPRRVVSWSGMALAAWRLWRGVQRVMRR